MLLANGHYIITTVMTGTELLVKDPIQTYFGIIQDWYAPGYNEFTEIDTLIDFSYQPFSIENDIGDTVKIASVGPGGWLLLEKIANNPTEDYTVNYKVVGKQDATIQFSNKLYNTNVNRTGFDTDTFDTTFHDNPIVRESKNCIRNFKR